MTEPRVVTSGQIIDTSVTLCHVTRDSSVARGVTRLRAVLLQRDIPLASGAAIRGLRSLQLHSD